MPTPTKDRGAFFDRLLYILFAPLIRRFIVLDAANVPDILKRSRKLREKGFRTSFDIMVENITDTAMMAEVHMAYEGLLQSMDSKERGNIVVKPTSLGLGSPDVTPEEGEARFIILLLPLLMTVSAMNKKGVSPPVEVEIDAESTATIGSTFRAITWIRKEYPSLAHVIRVAIPMHLRALGDHVATHELLEHPVRIVKGSGVYNEDPEKLVPEATVENRYRSYALKCLEEKSRPFIATMRDERLLREVLRSAEARGFGKDEFVIQMLYGLWTELGRRLIAEGYSVCIYIPIVLPWCRHASDGYVKRRVAMFRKLIWSWLTKS